MDDFKISIVQQDGSVLISDTSNIQEDVIRLKLGLDAHSEEYDLCDIKTEKTVCLNDTN